MPSATDLLRQAWKDYFSYRNHPHATSNEVERFAMAVQELKQLGWTLRKIQLTGTIFLR
jgi:hypothetical protein